MFTSSAGAQFCTVFTNVFVMLLLPTIIYFLRGFEGTAGLGDSLNSLLRIFPGYAISKGILFCGTADTLQKAREEFDDPEAVAAVD